MPVTTASRAEDRTPVQQPRLGPLGWVRYVWRQLTSMRTALLLLLLLAVAAVPGSIWPQRGVDPVAVRQYLDDSPTLGPWMDSLGLFDVYAAPWFAAIYLLLMISLVGCLVPRSKQHWHAIRAEPPRTPRRLERLPTHRHTVLAATPAEVLDAARRVLGRRRFRVRATDPEHPHDLSAEGGYLRETGNLVFHLSILGLIVSVGVGHLLSWRGEVILAEGQSFTSSVSRYDTIQAGPWVDEGSITPYRLTLDALEVTFEARAQGAQFGAPRQFDATVTWAAGPGEPARTEAFGVNNPLSVEGTSIYLLGNGYAPLITVRDEAGAVLYSQPTPFLPRDDNYGSSGAVKVPGAEPELGFYGAFLPTLRFDQELGPVSDFPGLVSPGLVLGLYEGDLFPQGRAQSVYSLDVAEMTQVGADDGQPLRVLLRPGETVDLPGDRGSITMDGVVRWAGLVARHDPGRLPALIWSAALLVGLVTMLTVRRRRVFVRVAEVDRDGQRHTEVSVAGLAKGSDPGLESMIEDLVEQVRESLTAPEEHRTSNKEQQ